MKMIDNETDRLTPSIFSRAPFSGEVGVRMTKRRQNTPMTNNPSVPNQIIYQNYMAMSVRYKGALEGSMVR